MKKLIAIAAAAVAIIALAWWGFFRQEPADPNAAFTQYFKPESSKAQEILAGFPSAFAGEMNAQDSLREAMKLYEAGKYDEACTALDSILVRHPANDTAQFYLAMSHLNASRYPKALTLLTSLTALDSSAFQLDSKWYLGLCYLKVDNGLPQAKEIFTALSEDAEYKDRQAARGILLLMAK